MSSHRYFAVVAALAVVMLTGQVLADSPPAKGHARCKRVVARTVNASELQVVGVVQQGNARKVLLMDSSREGYLVASGECASSERVPFNDWLARPIVRQ